MAAKSQKKVRTGLLTSKFSKYFDGFFFKQHVFVLTGDACICLLLIPFVIFYQRRYSKKIRGKTISSGSQIDALKSLLLNSSIWIALLISLNKILNMILKTVSSRLFELTNSVQLLIFLFVFARICTDYITIRSVTQNCIVRTDCLNSLMLSFLFFLRVIYAKQTGIKM